MTAILTAVGIAVLCAAVIALLAGLILAVASVVFAVPKDEKAEALKEVLPGANCGACGYSGCEGYAAAMACGDAAVGLCSPGGEETAKATASLLGVTPSLVSKTAKIACGGCDGMTQKTYEYRGVSSCAAAMRFYGGDKSCAYGCLGHGDCVTACAAEAITIENGIAAVNEALCIGCAACVKACPKGLITVSEATPSALVVCANRDKGGVARKDCSAACIGCMKCQRVCKAGAVTVTDHLAHVDAKKCTACGDCVEACPQGCIRI